MIATILPPDCGTSSGQSEGQETSKTGIMPKGGRSSSVKFCGNIQDIQQWTGWSSHNAKNPSSTGRKGAAPSHQWGSVNPVTVFPASRTPQTPPSRRVDVWCRALFQQQSCGWGGALVWAPSIVCGATCKLLAKFLRCCRWPGGCQLSAERGLCWCHHEFELFLPTNNRCILWVFLKFKKLTSYFSIIY